MLTEKVIHKVEEIQILENKFALLKIKQAECYNAEAEAKNEVVEVMNKITAAESALAKLHLELGKIMRTGG